jgi:hypothetical protein
MVASGGSGGVAVFGCKKRWLHVNKRWLDAAGCLAGGFVCVDRQTNQVQRLGWDLIVSKAVSHVTCHTWVSKKNVKLCDM